MMLRLIIAAVLARPHKVNGLNRVTACLCNATS